MAVSRFGSRALSGAGKSTIAHLVGPELDRRGHVVEYLDGDTVRTHLSKGLGFSKEDRDTNIERDRLGRLAFDQAGRRGDRGRDLALRGNAAEGACDGLGVGRLREVHVAASVEECARRDVKGLYEKAFKGEIKGFTGVDDPYAVAGCARARARHRSARSRGERPSRRRQARGARTRPRSRERMSAVATEHLIKPHGGSLVDRTGERPDGVDGLEQVPLTSRELSDLDMLASGALSPLEGFMGREDYERVVEEMRLGGGLPWRFPSASQSTARRRAIASHSRTRPGGRLPCSTSRTCSSTTSSARPSSASARPRTRTPASPVSMAELRATSRGA